MTVFSNHYRICFLCARHYGKCKNVTSEFMKLVLHLCPCVCVYVYLCTDMFVHMCVQEPLEARGWHWVSLQLLSPFLFLRQCFTESRTHPFSEIGCILSSRACPVSVSPTGGIVDACCGVWLFMWVVGSEELRSLCLSSRLSTDQAMFPALMVS